MNYRDGWAQLLIGALAMCVALSTGFAEAAAPGVCSSVQSGNWSDARIWSSGKTPQPGQDVTIAAGHTVTYDRSAAKTLGKLRVEGKLVFAPRESLEMNLQGNLIVAGVLRLHPAEDDVRHVITFREVDESAYVGGGMKVLDSDVGLWVTDDGRLDVAGSGKTPWTRLTGPAEAGQTTIAVENAEGWQPGDRLQIVPTLPPTAGEDCWAGYDGVTVAAVEGNRVTVEPALKFDHPEVNGEWTAEVLNLTRNAVIQGTPEGRAHVIFLIEKPQTIKNAELRHLGPRQQDDDGRFTHGVLGRYALHFHHNEDGSRGSVVDNVVIHSAGNHAFVPHDSHGVTFRRCITHNTFEDAYWWDPGKGNATDDVLFEDCVASLVRCDPPFRGPRLTGFNLRHGDGNEITGCVAVGVLGRGDSSGFHWPDPKAPIGIWNFHDNLGHNNKQNGIFTWQNTGDIHLVRQFAMYHNGRNGIEHGAYKNPYFYRDGILYGNGNAGLQLHAVSRAGRQLKFQKLRIDGGGISRYGVEVVKHVASPGQPTWIEECTFTGYREAGVAFTFDGDPDKAKRELFDIVACRFEPGMPKFLLSKRIHPDSLITVEPIDDAAAFQLRRFDRRGKRIDEWNARRAALAEAGTRDSLENLKAIRNRFTESWTGDDGGSWPDRWSLWQLDGGPPRVVIDGNRGLVQSPGSGGIMIARAATSPAHDVDQAVTFRLSTNVPTAGLVARQSDAEPDTFYATDVGLGRHDPLTIFRMVEGERTVLARAEKDQNSRINDETDYRLRFRVASRGRGTDLMVKLWKAGDPEPEDWSLKVPGDHQRQLRGQSGRFGLWTRQGGNRGRKVWYDDYQAESVRYKPNQP